jgi:peptide/nickel transport system substrate-binding protein
MADLLKARESKLLRVLASAFATMLIVTGCSSGGSETSDESGSTPTTIVLADNEPPQTFDPIQAGNSTVNAVVIPLYDTLIDFDAKSELGSRLAESWTVSEDGLKIDMTLRSGVKFHDGAELTSADVQYTMDRVKELNVGVAAEVLAYDSTTVKDNLNFTINLSEPSAPFLSALSRIYILNSALVKANEGSDLGQAWLSSNDAGSGPYTLKSYATNQEAAFEKFPDYYRGFDGQADSVVIRYIVESSTQRDALLNGDVDIAYDVATTDLASFESNADFEVTKADTLVQLYIFFNMQKGETVDPKVREAIRLAYDYQSHVDSILAGNGAIAEGPLPSVMNCHANIAPGKQDLEKAKQLLAEAGKSDLKLTMSYLSVIEEMNRAGTLLQSALREIGVELTLQTVTFPEYMEQVSTVETTPDLGMIYAFPSYPDPHSVLAINFDSTYIGGGYNYASYNNPEVDSLVRDAAVSTDQAVRCSLYEKVQQIVEGDFVSINISNPKFVVVKRAGITGDIYRPAHHNTLDIYNIKLTN